jgi:hypothetical protein
MRLEPRTTGPVPVSLSTFSESELSTSKGARQDLERNEVVALVFDFDLGFFDIRLVLVDYSPGPQSEFNI